MNRMADWKTLLTTTIDSPITRLILGSKEQEKRESSQDTTADFISAQMSMGGMAADIYDQDWKLVWVSKELKLILGAEEADIGLGKHILEVLALPAWRSLMNSASLDTIIDHLSFLEPELLTQLDLSAWTKTEYKKLEKALNKNKANKFSYDILPLDLYQAELPPVRVWCHTFSLDNGYHVHTFTPGLRASVLSLVSRGDERMFEQMAELFEPSPHSSAILFLDLEGSTQLGKIMPREAYFQLLSKMSRSIDDSLLAHGGIVGKHVGDGAVAFVIGDENPSSAVKNALKAAIDAQNKVDKMGKQLNKELEGEVGLKLNGAIHYSQGLYMGQVVTGGRLEVTALGEEVNECARMLEAAKNGSIILSKSLCETLSVPFAHAGYDFDPSSLVYTPLSEFDNLSHKGNNDSGHLSVYRLKND